MTDDPDYDAYLALEHHEQQQEWAVARALLKRLNVLELRTLYAHYFGGKASDWTDIPKKDLLDELSVEYADREF